MLRSCSSIRTLLLGCLVGASLAGAASGAPPPGGHARPLWREVGSSPSPALATPLSSTLPGDPAPDPFDVHWVAMPLPGITPNVRPVSMAEFGGDLLLGGSLRGAGRTRASFVTRWDGTNFNAMGDPPRAVVELLVSGGVVYAVTDGSNAAFPAHILKWNGVSWDEIGTVPAHVNAIAMHAGELVIGGNFASVNGVPALDVAAYDGSNWRALAGLPANANVSSLRSFAGNLYAGLEAFLVGSTGGPYRWDGSNWSIVGSGLDGLVQSLTDDGVSLYASGIFTKAGADSVPGVARWTGALWQRIGVATPSSVSHVAWAGGALYISNLYRIARFDGANWVPTNPPFTNSPSALGEWGGKLVALAVNSPAGPGDIPTVASFDGASWTPIHEPWAPDMIGLDHWSYAATIYNDRLAVSGAFHFAGAGTQATRANYEALFDGSSWSALGVTNGAGPQGFGLTTWGSELVVVGWPTENVAGPLRSAAHWNGSSWQVFDPGMFPYTWAAVEHLGSLYVGGDFDVTDAAVPDSILHVARWTGSTWQTLGDGLREAPGDYATVYSLASWNGQFVAGGRFAIAGGLSAANVAQWDGGNWTPLGAGLDGECYALESWNGMLVAGGDFLNAGGSPAPGAAYWDGAAWHPMGTEAVEVMDFAQIDGTLYAVGEFRHADASVTSTVARWTGANWQLLGSGAPVKEPLRWVQGYHGDLYTGGQISYAFGNVTGAITRLPAANTLGVKDGPVITTLALAASPNPGRGSTMFSFALPTSGWVRLAVYDAAGREVARLVDGDVPAGRHEARWIAATAPGVYFARLDGPGGSKRVARVVRFE